MGVKDALHQLIGVLKARVVAPEVLLGRLPAVRPSDRDVIGEHERDRKHQVRQHARRQPHRRIALSGPAPWPAKLGGQHDQSIAQAWLKPKHRPCVIVPAEHERIDLLSCSDQITPKRGRVSTGSEVEDRDRCNR